MKKANIGAPEFSWDESDPPGFRAGMARLGSLLGATETGITVYELPPGQGVCPYHYEVGEEEWLLVLDGAPTLRTPDGEQRLRRWDVVCFPRGPEGAHGIRNATEEPVRVLMFSSVVLPTATVYPDSDKIGLWTGDPETDVLVRRSAKVDYYDGEA
ncbi:MAG TPA: cupin domain-containing protein [Solirubrobacterales bacterium]|nr:cupin domain-containing protein [Solirubrobacterales bacterium]